MLDFFLSLFLVYQYWLLFGVMYIASIGFPIPATALMIAGWAFFAQGYFNLSLLFFSGTIGCILGDISGYGLSYIYGKGIFRRLGLSKILNSSQFTSFKPIFIRRNIFSVFITRFLITGLGPSVNILAGITKMKSLTFIVIDIVGESIYIILNITIGYTFSSQWQSILEILESFSTMLMTLCLLGIFLYIYRKHQLKTNHFL